MGIIKFDYVISCSSQDHIFSVDNLLLGPGSKPWLCSSLDKSGHLEAELHLSVASYINYVDIGNCGSSTVEVLVGRNCSPRPTNYISFLPAVTLLPLADIKKGTDRNAVYMFNESNLNTFSMSEKWDRIKIICSQPYQRTVQFGLSFICLRNKEWSLEPQASIELSLTPKKESIEEEETAEKVFFPSGPKFQISRINMVLDKLEESASKAKERGDLASNVFRELVEAFLVACRDDDREKKYYKEYMQEFEEQREKKLSTAEILIFMNLYFKIFEKSRIPVATPLKNTAANLVDTNLRRGTGLSNLSPRGKKRIFPTATATSPRFPSPPKSKSPTLPLSEEDLPKYAIAEEIKTSGYKLQPLEKFYKVEPKESKHGKRPQKRNFCRTADVIPSDSGQSFESSSASGWDINQPSTSTYGLDSDRFKTSASDSVVPLDIDQPSTSRGFTFVECPICGEPYHPSDIEEHASSCGDYQEPYRYG